MCVPSGYQKHSLQKNQFPLKMSELSEALSLTAEELEWLGQVDVPQVTTL
jgi:hypothetical protein